MNKNPSIPGLVAGIFLLIWAAILLSWMPVDSLRLITGIMFVPVGVLLIARYVMARRKSGRATMAAPPGA
ncbi:hypothetical protein [Arthrobacter sp. fls2-241-R2A-200]|uniref:hypothetical protein n=1 Tax=Arthrobacter sp. fls2-241-R2A-200 TaxID=3040281 RepID=UPI00254B449A|nr:hypothetical protein [Arthrobacter sp. fls2-241-R2A-200]